MFCVMSYFMMNAAENLKLGRAHDVKTESGLHMIFTPKIKKFGLQQNKAQKQQCETS